MKNIIFTKELKELHGDDIYFLFKGAEPFTPMQDTNKRIPLGVLIEKDNKVLCFECDKWFEVLNTSHLKSHGLTSAEYKEKYGFSSDVGLCNKEISAYRSSIAMRNKKKFPNNLYGSPKKKPIHFDNSNTKRSVQKRNKTNTCEAQIYHRLSLVASLVGHSPSIPETAKYDAALIALCKAQYGSWLKAKEKLGFEKTDLSLCHQGIRKQDAELIYDIREYVRKHNKLPFNSKNSSRLDNFPHSDGVYLQRWGSKSKAWKHCGISKTKKIEVIHTHRYKTGRISYTNYKKNCWEVLE